VQLEALAFYKRLIAIGKEQGDIALEIDEDLGALIFDSMFSALGQLVKRIILERKGEWENYLFLEDPEILRLFDQTMNILERGFGPTQPVRESDQREEVVA
jgi:hypothetical protein